MAKHGRYRIVRRVADGGMAEIFLATQMGREGFQKPVILKRIHSAIYADPQFRNMFIDEAHISMSLSHSNIVQILDLGVSDGRYFLVLELVDGWDLGRVLQRAGAAGTRLPRELGLYIIANVCRALAYAHSKTEGDRPLGIVHRDVSPHNILLSEQGEVKLTDFGIAKAMNKREQTGTGVVKGKVAFMSPEQAMGKPIDQRSDLFSLGTILYLIMTRVRPFEGPTDLETLLRVQKGDFTPAEAMAPDLEPEVAAIIARAMHTDPAARYQTADEMLSDLEAAARTAFSPVGQTELKRWLAQLAAVDGMPSIGRAPERQASPRSGTGSGELDGNDVVLLDSQEVDDEEEEVVNGEEATSLAVVGGEGARPRISRARSANSLPLPTGAETAVEGRATRAELSLPIPDEEPPHRRRARGGGGGFMRLLLLAAVVGPLAWFGAKYARQFLGDQTAGQAGANANAAEPAAPPPAAAATGTKAEKSDKPAREEKREAKVAAGPVDAGTRERGEAHAESGESGSRRAAEHETTAHRAHAAEKAKDRPHRTGPDLKALMAPDPSQLPSDPAPAANP